MIAAALRTEIDRFCQSALERSEPETLEPCALAAQRLTRGLRCGSGEESLPSMRELGELLDRTAEREPASALACRALTEHLVAQVVPSPGASAAREAALDAIDDLVDDPTCLPVLRSALATFSEHLQRFFQEATRAPRRRGDVTASAA